MSETVAIPAFGRLTFDAEGQEGGPFHSRVFHVPTSSSGLTIGRGYDMKKRTKSQVRDDLIAAGVNFENAVLISQAAGLSGERAEEFIEENDLEDFEISQDMQVRLFEIEYRRQEADTRRLATKADVVRAYGDTDWDALDPVIKEVVVDLRFRGDYGPTTRKFLQAYIAENDVDGFSKEVCDRGRWPGVPQDRFNRRCSFCQQAMTA
jgi:hypothetical protein